MSHVSAPPIPRVSMICRTLIGRERVTRAVGAIHRGHGPCPSEIASVRRSRKLAMVLLSSKKFHCGLGPRRRPIRQGQPAKTCSRQQRIVQNARGQKHSQARQLRFDHSEAKTLHWMLWVGEDEPVAATHDLGKSFRQPSRRTESSTPSSRARSNTSCSWEPEPAKTATARGSR